MSKDESELSAQKRSTQEFPVSAIIIPFPTRRKGRARKRVQPRIELVPLNFKIESDVRRQFMRFCMAHGLPRNEAFRRAFDLLRAEMDK